MGIFPMCKRKKLVYSDTCCNMIKNPKTSLIFTPQPGSDSRSSSDFLSSLLYKSLLHKGVVTERDTSPTLSALQLLMFTDTSMAKIRTFYWNVQSILATKRYFLSLHDQRTLLLLKITLPLLLVSEDVFENILS